MVCSFDVCKICLRSSILKTVFPVFIRSAILLIFHQYIINIEYILVKLYHFASFLLIYLLSITFLVPTYWSFDLCFNIQYCCIDLHLHTIYSLYPYIMFSKPSILQTFSLSSLEYTLKISFPVRAS